MLTSIILLLSLLMISCLLEIEVLLPYYVAPGTTNSLGQSAITFSTYGSGNAKLMTRAIANSASGTGYDGIVFNRWYADTVVLGIPIEWDDVL